MPTQVGTSLAKLLCDRLKVSSNKSCKHAIKSVIVFAPPLVHTAHTVKPCILKPRAMKN